ncbi:MAG: DUF5930 domain-containing protein [Acidobacteriota bacterium]
MHRLHAAIARRLPEQRLFLRSDTETRFIRLGPLTQAAILGGSALVLAWTLFATSVLLIDSIGNSDAARQAQLREAQFERRIAKISAERDARAAEALAAQQRFSVALEQVSHMQSALLASEERRRELETGIGVIQSTLKSAMNDRDAARDQALALTNQLNGKAPGTERLARADETADQLEFLTDALTRTAAERDTMAGLAEAAKSEAEELALDKRLMEERNNEIFRQLEDVVTVSMEPLDKMFEAAGLNPEDILAQVQRGYSGIGGPVGPLAPSIATKGAAADPAAARAAKILEGFDRMNLYRIAVEKTPFALPLRTAFRYTSPFGRRWGRMHEGVDLAGSMGSPVLATADGVVVFAGWESGYGQLVRVKHDFGLETRYGHLSEIRVKVGQRVSRGDRIGDMGNSGRSTGTHLHYEVRVNGTAINPMTYIKAAKDVF